MPVGSNGMMMNRSRMVPRPTRNSGILTPTWQRFKVADDEYSTPQDLFDHYHRRFKFTLDVCATPKLAKCKKFYTPAQNGLSQDWGREICWMNPPYRQWPGAMGQEGVGVGAKRSHRGVPVACLHRCRMVSRLCITCHHRTVEGAIAIWQPSSITVTPLLRTEYIFSVKSQHVAVRS